MSRSTLWGWELAEGDRVEARSAVAPATRTARKARSRAQLILVVVIAMLAAAVGLSLYSAAIPVVVDAPLPNFTVAPSSGQPTVGSIQVPDEARELGPDRLLVPSLGIRAPLVSGSIVSVAGDRTLEIPSDPAKLTIFADGAQPCGTLGTVLVAGHVINGGVRGALWPLASIKPDALVFMTCADGTLTAWRAVSAERTEKSELPQTIFTATGPLRAVLVTCGGPVMSDGHFRDNVLVTLEPVGLNQ